MTPAELALLDRLDADCEELISIVRERWTVARDPLGAVMMVPTGWEGDPCEPSELPWREIVATFTEAHDRPPTPGSRALVQRRFERPTPKTGGGR